MRAWPDEAFLDLVFLRLNTGSVQLSPQELRQALRPGPFTDFTDVFSAESEWMQKALRIDGPDFRMRDVEVLLRYFGFRYFLRDYRGQLKDFLDSTLERLNKRWEAEEGALIRSAQDCEAAIKASFEIFADDAFFRYDDDKGRYERRFNRAVFDMMVWYFATEDVRAQAVVERVRVREAFETLCGDRDFRSSITTTTKSVGATYLRLSLWGATLQNVLGANLQVPQLQDNRIVLPAPA